MTPLGAAGLIAFVLAIVDLLVLWVATGSPVYAALAITVLVVGALILVWT